MAVISEQKDIISGIFKLIKKVKKEKLHKDKKLEESVDYNNRLIKLYDEDIRFEVGSLLSELDEMNVFDMDDKLITIIEFYEKVSYVHRVSDTQKEAQDIMSIIGDLISLRELANEDEYDELIHQADLILQKENSKQQEIGLKSITTNQEDIEETMELLENTLLYTNEEMKKEEIKELISNEKIQTHLQTQKQQIRAELEWTEESIEKLLAFQGNFEAFMMEIE